MYRSILPALIVLLTNFIAAQNIGIGTLDPAQSAILEISSTTQGTLLPRMTTAQRKAIQNADPGLLVFDLNKHTIYLYDGNTWRPMLVALTDAFNSPLVVHEADNSIAKSFGKAVAIDGEYAIIGAAQDDISGNENQGSAYIFKNVNGVWIEQQKLTANDGAAMDAFGSNVDISGDYAVIGVSNHNVGSNFSQGAVYVFKRNGTIWEQQTKLLAYNGAALDRFGSSVAIDGDRIIASAPYRDTNGHQDNGAVYIFKRAPSTEWSLEAIISPLTLTSHDHFGSSVDIDSVTVIIGALADDSETANDSGSAYIFHRVAQLWIQAAFLSVNGGQTGDHFGYAVGIDGEYAIVGAPDVDYNGHVDCGRVYMYQYNGSNWLSIQQIYSPEIQQDGQFGNSVAIDGDYVVVGSPKANGQYQFQGKVWVYHKPAFTWKVKRAIVDQSADNIDYFGFDVGISGFQVLMGAHRKYSFHGEAFFLDLE